MEVGLCHLPADKVLLLPLVSKVGGLHGSEGEGTTGNNRSSVIVDTQAESAPQELPHP